MLSRAPGRAANTDEWDQDAPVFLSPLDVRLLQPQSDPDYRECRVYVRPRPGSSVLVGENNVGLLHLERDMVTHQLISPDRSGSPRVATIDPVAPV